MCAVMWMDFKSMVLRERSQTQRDHVLYDSTRHRAESKTVGAEIRSAVPTVGRECE